MKALAQMVMIGGGIIGSVLAIPFAVVIWMMRGALSPDEKGILVLYCVVLPAACIASIFAGVWWRRADARSFEHDGRESEREEQPNQPPQHNAGSRPSSGDSPASKTPSSLGPRG